MLHANDPDVLLLVLADVAYAKGMAQVAKEADHGRESQYKALGPGAKPAVRPRGEVHRRADVSVSEGARCNPSVERSANSLARVAPDFSRLHVAAGCRKDQWRSGHDQGLLCLLMPEMLLRGIDVGYSFNDTYAMMAFVCAGHDADAAHHAQRDLIDLTLIEVAERALPMP